MTSSPKDEQIQALKSSIQDLKQQLASAQQHITANDIAIKNMSKQLEDDLDGTRQELNAATLKGRQMKEELTKLFEERFKSFTIQEGAHQVAALATSHKKLKGNLYLLNFVVLVTFAMVLAFLFLPCSIVHDVEKTETTNCRDKMRNLSADPELSRMYTLIHDQGLQIKRLNDMLNGVRLQIENESEIVELLCTNISAVNQTTVSVINDMKGSYDQDIVKMRKLVTDMLSKVDDISNGQVLQSHKLADIEKDLNITKSHMQGEIKIAELVAENISTINKTTLKIVNDLRVQYNHEIMKMTNLVTNLSSKVDTLRKDQMVQLQKLANIEVINVTHSHMQSEIELLELVTELQKNISAISNTALVGISELKAQQALLCCSSDHPQYRKKLTIKAHQLEKSLAKPNNRTFSVIVMVSGIISMANSMLHLHTHNWANASINIQGEPLFLSLQKINNTYYKVILCEPLPFWCYNLSIKNQIKDSSHYRIRSILSIDRFISHRTRINRIKEKQDTTGCISFSSELLKFEELLKITSDYQYVACDSIFILMECDDLKLEFNVSP